MVRITLPWLEWVASKGERKVMVEEFKFVETIALLDLVSFFVTARVSWGMECVVGTFNGSERIAVCILCTSFSVNKGIKNILNK
jgi:hypothetical protein